MVKSYRGVLPPMLLFLVQTIRHNSPWASGMCEKSISWIPWNPKQTHDTKHLFTSPTVINYLFSIYKVKFHCKTEGNLPSGTACSWDENEAHLYVLLLDCFPSHLQHCHWGHLNIHFHEWMPIDKIWIWNESENLDYVTFWKPLNPYSLNKM